MGIYSPEKFINYTFEAVLSSTAGDDDMIGFILGYKYISGSCYYLSVYVNPSITSEGGGKIQLQEAHANGVQTALKTIWTDQYYPPNNWREFGSIRLKAVRNGNNFTFYATKPNELDKFLPELTFTYNIKNSSNLQWLWDEPSPYGYYCYSQQFSTWSDVSFSGSGFNAEELYDYELNCVWVYQNGQWVKTKKTLQEALGYPRIIISATDGTKFQILENEIKKIN